MAFSLFLPNGRPAEVEHAYASLELVTMASLGGHCVLGMSAVVVWGPRGIACFKLLGFSVPSLECRVRGQYPNSVNPKIALPSPLRFSHALSFEQLRVAVRLRTTPLLEDLAPWKKLLFPTSDTR